MDNFITLGQYEAAFPGKVKPEVYAYVTGGSASELSLRRNRAALERIVIEQRIGMDVRTIDLSTRLLGMDLPVPFAVCPMGGMPQIWPRGDVEMARGATLGGLLAVANSGGPLQERVEVASGPLMYQLYNYGDRDWAAARVEEIQAAGYKALTLTVDTGVPSRRDAHLEALFTAAGGQLPPARAPQPGNDPTYLSMITWEYVRFLRDLIKIPFGLKGIMHPDDARASLDCGLDFVWISNHGGRQLDSGRATIDALPRVAQAVDNRIPIIIDGGFRRGTDIIKGLALGATLVAIGRPYMWGLAQGGADGAAAISRLLETELRVDLALAGHTAVRTINRDMVDYVNY
ncbi:MAG: alpha-hydroxy-acid oxidizing protein [Chloroflexi bacterium]|nr:alpha-hydroxy-acid oxidizing protein [Chloroflexota bacterium]